MIFEIIVIILLYIKEKLDHKSTVKKQDGDACRNVVLIHKFLNWLSWNFAQS